MKTRMLRKAVATTVAATMVLSVPVYAKEDKKVTIDQIELGKDYTDIKADLKFLTHKTDIVDTVFKGYVEEFQKLYPNVNIEYVKESQIMQMMLPCVFQQEIGETSVWFLLQ